MISSRSDFIGLIRLGIGHSADLPFNSVAWSDIFNQANQHGLLAIAMDGIEKLSKVNRPPQEQLLEWIGNVLQSYENRYKDYCKVIGEMANFYNSHGIKMMILKGYACSLDWPKPEHRPCGDIDIWMFGQQKEADAALAASFKSQVSSFKIDGTQHHHTVFEWNGFTVENHYDFINVHHHQSHRGLELIFKELGQDDSHFVEIGGERVYVPSPNLHALFLLRHGLNHFASIGINLRNLLDWAFFVEKHTHEIDWKWLQSVIEEYHMQDFYNCINAICVEDLGFNSSIFPSVQVLPSLKEKIVNDILAPKITIEEPMGSLCKWIHKYRRWKGNRWKQKLCYKENVWSAIWGGLRVHLLKPKVK